MAFTFEQFETRAKELGFTDRISQADWELARRNPSAGMSLLQYKQDYVNATNDQARALANSGAERIRREFGGYTGGADGSGYYLESPGPSSFSPKDTPEYSYDMESDPIYQAYAKQHAREGQRAVQETIGQAAAMTGGMPSTAAITAATQAGDYYAAQMADKVPELEQNAYARYLDSVAQNNYENQFDYQQHKDQQSQANYDKEIAYKQEMDRLDLEAQGRAEALEKAILAAQYGDTSYLKALGINIPELESGGYTGYLTEPETVTEFDGADMPNDPGVIARLQTMLGIFADGEWGYESQRAAEEAGYRNFTELVYDLQGSASNTGTSSESDQLSRKIQIENLIENNSWMDDAALAALINGRDLSKNERNYAFELIRNRSSGG